MNFKLLVLLGAVLTYQYVIPERTAACRCIAPEAKRDFETADAVFIGKAVHTVRQAPMESSYRFKVRKALKGTLGKQVEIKTNGAGTCPEPHFIIGQEYVIYARGKKPYLIKECTPRRQWLPGENERKILGGLGP